MMNLWRGIFLIIITRKNYAIFRYEYLLQTPGGCCEVKELLVVIRVG